MDRPYEGRLWIPDDKARTMAWNVSEHAYLMTGLNQMARDMTHWRQMTDSPDCIAKLNEGLHRLVARKERVHLSRKKDWPASVVPYAYCTIKSKCHDQSAQNRGRTCKKPGHSCTRKSSAGGITRRVRNSAPLVVQRRYGCVVGVLEYQNLVCGSSSLVVPCVQIS